MSDHNGLRYLFDQPKLNARKARWLATLNEFDFKVRYIKGKENMVEDAINRRIHMNHIATVSYYGTSLQEQILQAGQHDDRYQQLRHKLQ